MKEGINTFRMQSTSTRPTCMARDASLCIVCSNNNSRLTFPADVVPAPGKEQKESRSCCCPANDAGRRRRRPRRSGSPSRQCGHLPGARSILITSCVTIVHSRSHECHSSSCADLQKVEVAQLMLAEQQALRQN